MKLSKLVDGLVDVPAKLSKDVEIKGIALDSRKVEKDFVFIAVKGAIEHGLVYLQNALENGANAVIYDPSDSEVFELNSLKYAQLAVKDLGLKLGIIADRFYQSPSKKLNVIGITGTNGKTTCSQYLLQLIPDCGVIGTLGWGAENKNLRKTENTTPDALAVHEILADFISLNVHTVVMEVSSHGLQQGRVNEVSFKGAIYTNLSRDHLDYHDSMESYLQAKLVLFKQPGLAFVVVNGDDEKSDCFLGVIQPDVQVWVFSTKANNCQLVEQETAEYITAEGIDYSLNGISFLVCWRNQKVLVETRIVGDFNLENILAVIAVLLAQGVALETAAKKASKLVPVPGRMEQFGGNGKPYVIVDYAHTPDALEKVLKGIRKNCQQQLWVVFGCGGDRDRGKRSQMGNIAQLYADQVMITNDNPRCENAQQIIDDIIKGCSKHAVEIIKSRELAIQTVIKKANKNDCIVIAGKGHEDYQEVNGIKQPFRDQDVVMQVLQEWKLV